MSSSSSSSSTAISQGGGGGANHSTSCAMAEAIDVAAVTAAIRAPSCSGSSSSSAVDENVAACSSFELDAWMRDEPMPECLMDFADVELMEPCSSDAMHPVESQNLCAPDPQIQQQDCSSSSIGLGDVFDDHNHDDVKKQQWKSFVPDLKKIIVKKPIMDKAVERLGGGRKGAIRLWKFIQVWLAEQQQQPMSQQFPDGLMLPLDTSDLLLSTEMQLSPQMQAAQVSQQHMYANAFAGRHQQQQQQQQNLSTVAAPVHPPGDHQFFYNNNNSNKNADTFENVHMSPAATTRAARKSRMARQRRRCSASQHPIISNSSPWPSSGHHLQAAADHHQAATRDSHRHQPAAYTCRDGKDRSCDKNLNFLLQKELKPSDVGNLGRIVLPKEKEKSHH